MNDAGGDSGEIASRLMAILGGFQKRINSLEKQIAKLQERDAEQAIGIARLDMWQNGNAIGHLSRIYPKTRTVIFLGQDFFGENVKYAYLKFLEVAARENIECLFLPAGRDLHAFLLKHGLPCLPDPADWSLEHYKVVLGASVAVAYDNFTPRSWSTTLPYFFLQGARLVQLWHGIPMKDVGLIRNEGPSQKNIITASVGPADVLVAPGAKMEKDWAGWVAFRELAPVGYPRNDVLLREPDARDLLNVDEALWRDVNAAKAAGRKVIFYGPTFRDSAGHAWLENSGLGKFAEWCAAQGHFLFAKTHPMIAAANDLAQKMPGVRFVDPLSDVYPLLSRVDALITDYSSFAFDFLLLERPIVYFRPDHAAYLASCRNLRSNYEELSPGPVALNADELCVLTGKILGGGDTWSGARRALRKELFDHCDSKASERVAQIILKQLAKPQEARHMGALSRSLKVKKYRLG